MSSQFVYIYDCSSGSVTTSAYREIITSSTDSCTQVQCLYHNALLPDTHFKLAIGAAGQEVDVIVSCSGDPIPIRLFAEPGTRFSVQAIGSNITSGLIIISLLP